MFLLPAGALALIVFGVILLVGLLAPQKAQSQSVASFQTTKELRAQAGTTGLQALTAGRDSMADGKARTWFWNPSLTLPDDSSSVVRVPGAPTPGGWQRILFSIVSVQNLSDSLTMLRQYTQNIGKTLLYNKAGLVSAISKRFTDTFSVSSATPTISLAAILTIMGCTNYSLVSATGFRSGGTVSNSPQVSVSGLASNSVSLVLSQQNTATVQILGINVLSGLPQILVPDPQNTKVILSFDAW